MDTEAFERCFVAWVAALTGVPTGVVAIDGKTVRRSGSKTSKRKKKDVKGPIHIVSAFAARQRLVLGQVKVAEKSNEIVAIPKLLRMLAIEGAVVTIDAMGCQRDIAQTIIDKKADYILALKGNQGTLKDDVKLFVDEQKAVDFKDTKVSQDKTIDGDHGRIETRTVTVIHDVGWLQEQPRVAGPEKRRHGREQTRNRRQDRNRDAFLHHFAGLAGPPIGPMIRSHWMVENGLHWVLDMIFRDDECRVRTDNAPFNLAIVKHIAFNVCDGPQTKDFNADAPKSRRMGR